MKKIPGLTEMDVIVLEVIEQDTKQHGLFIYYLVHTIVFSDSDNQDNFRKTFPVIMESFDKWKSGLSGQIYDNFTLNNRHLTLVT